MAYEALNQNVQSHRDLVAWQRAMQFVTRLYHATSDFPSDEKFGLTTQIRRAAVSIPSNIAEGYGRGMTQEYLRFLRMARGSLFELDTQLLLARHLEYIRTQAYEELEAAKDDVGRLLAGLIRSIEAKTRDKN